MWLHCNAIWLNPIFDSPFMDAGYDVRNYKLVAERYGTNDDLIELFNKAHEKGIKILLDLVPGHTSDQCEWFIESQKPEKNEFSNRYTWTDSVWEAPPQYKFVCGITNRDGNYLVNFFSSQPALNYGFAEITHPNWQLPPSHPDCQATVEAMKDGEVILLENTRYRAEETKNGDEFSKELASLCDVFVNDAFGTAHRAHCSNVGVASLVDTAVVGYLMQKEIDFLGNAVNNPVRPFVAILGGAKVADKLNVINNLLEKCDTLIIGGGMAYTFIKAQGGKVGISLVDDSKLDYCLDMMKKAEELGKKLLLPIDTVAADGFPNPIDAEIETMIVPTNAIPDDKEGLDIGPKTRELFADAVKNAKTVVWNGPMGVSENPCLAAGTIAVAKALADTDATTIIGGGDSAAAVNNLGFGDKMTHISTGGGASLEFLEGKDLPGVVAANDK